MGSNRTKKMFELLNINNTQQTEDDQNNNLTSETSAQTEKDYVSDTTDSRPSSPLPDGAANIHEEMPDVWNSAFSDVTHHENLLSDNIAQVNIENTLPKNTSTLDVVHKDTFLCTDVMSPDQIISCPPSVSYQLLNDSPMPLTPIFNNLSQELMSPIQNVAAPVSPAIPHHNVTPVPSPLNKHSNCNDSFCCEHEPDYFACQSVESIDSTQTETAANSGGKIRSRGKRRPRNESEWGANKRKKLKNLGKQYCNKKGRTVNEKKVRPPCSCKWHCVTKFSQEKRLDIFTKFWDLGVREKQWLYVAHYTTKKNKSRTFHRELKHNRQFTYKYFLPCEATESDASNTKVNVCKTMFLNTLGISERMTRTAWQKFDGSTAVEKDMRGRHKNHTKVIDEEMIKSVCGHVNSFAPVESHYTRKSSKRLYLDGSLSVARMFGLYKEWSDLEKYDNKATTSSLRQYRDIINSNFNLSFHIPKKDTCDQCHIFKNKDNPSEQEKENYTAHQNNKKIARELKQSDKEEATASNGIILCATFDFQKVLTCPHGQMSCLYYKRKLSCYHFTIYDLATKQGYCYVWDETVAKRGANEVSSCLYDFIKKHADKGVKDFRLWSDNCAGQNRNRIVFAMYAFAAKEFGVTITHRFLEKGHTQNEGDSVHSVIERAAENKLLYVPEEWKLLIRWAKTTDKPYEIIDVTQELMFDFKKLLLNKNWTKNTVNSKVPWTKIKEVFLEESNTNLMHYKLNFDEQRMTLVLQKQTRGRGAAVVDLTRVYSAPIPISNEKHKDLVSLCKAGIIPEKYQNYFIQLHHGHVVVESDDE